MSRTRLLTDMFKFGSTRKAQRNSTRLADPDVLLSILDNLPTSIFVKDDQLRFVYSNTGHCELIGKSEEQLLGKSDTDFYDASVAAGFLANDMAVVKSGTTNETEEQATRQDGSSITVVTRKARHVAPDGKTYLIGTNADLTEVKNREHQYRMLSEAVPVGVIQIDESGVVQFANQLATKTLAMASQPRTLAEISLQLENVGEDFPSRAAKFETHIKPTGRRILVISSGFNEAPSLQKKSAIVSIVDITEMTNLRTEIEEKSTHLGAVVGQARESVASIGVNTANLNNGALILSRQTVAQMTSLQTISVAIRQLAAVVKQNSSNSDQARKLSLDATLVAEEGHRMSAESADAMSKITGSTQKIVSIVDLIQEIAFQTNLLALNAAVEAARAGESGKGFAVVAAEVRTLAQRSAQALKNVRLQIEEGNTQMAQGEQLILSMGSKLGDISRITKETATLVASIASSSQEQAIGFQQIDASVALLEKAGKSNSQLVENVKVSIDSVDRAMGELIKLVDMSADKKRDAA